MKFQLLGKALYLYSYNEENVAGPFGREFDAESFDAAVEQAVKILEEDGYAEMENGILKLKGRWHELSAEIREFKVVAKFDFCSAVPEQIPEPEHIVPAKPGKPALPARVEIRRL